MAETGPVWPRETKLQRFDGKTTLVLFAHPRCPCTRTSLAELQSILPAAREHVTTYVVFLRPEGLSDDWAKSDLWRAVGNMPGVERIIDYDGQEAARFGSRTSGQTLVYDRAGRLIFSGGITLARGHAGDNDGRRRVIALLKTGRADADTAAVYGCGLQTPVSRGRKS